MTTRAIVPNGDGEGSLGTASVKWGAVYSSDPASGENSGQVPTTAWVQNLVALEVPTGVVQAFAGSTTPQGWLLCDGSAVSRSDYAALYAVIGTTYGAGNGSTTFNLPNLVDKFVEGSATAGTVKSAGLPNITGRGWNVGGTNILDWSGAFKQTALNQIGQSPSGSSLGGGWINFNASLSNSIYGNSSTVQPPALTMRYIIKY